LKLYCINLGGRQGATHLHVRLGKPQHHDQSHEDNLTQPPTVGHGPEHQYYSWEHQKETQVMPAGWNPSRHVCMPHVQTLLVFQGE
jgi:hypothetical protein